MAECVGTYISIKEHQITHHKVTDAEVFRVRRPFHSIDQIKLTTGVKIMSYLHTHNSVHVLVLQGRHY